MDLNTLSLAMSGFSLVVAVVSAYISYRISEYQIRLSARNDFQKLLLEANRELIDNPELWAIYDNHPLAARFNRDDPMQCGRLEAFAYMYVNLLEMVYTFYNESGRMTSLD